MEKPEPPAARELRDTTATPYPGHIYLCDGWAKVCIFSAEEAEMLIFALQEWIEYKRQLELWERESNE